MSSGSCGCSPIPRYNLGQRHISLSTCGLVDRIYDLAKEDLGITLSISLHAPDNETRNKTQPVNRRWPVEQLMQALPGLLQNHRTAYLL